MEPIKRLPNGSKAPPTFSAVEMARRLAALRAAMAGAALDAVLLTSYHSINDYGDFLYCAFGRPYGLVVDHARTASIHARPARDAVPARDLSRRATVTLADLRRLCKM